jgi:hypothetical protein
MHLLRGLRGSLRLRVKNLNGSAIWYQSPESKNPELLTGISFGLVFRQPRAAQAPWITLRWW